MSELRDQVRAEKEYLVSLRRDFHRHPELALQENRTAEVIERELERFGISHTRVGATGVLGVLLGTQRGRGVVALRADIDALPIQETNDVGYRSQTDGVMHACGHDAHTVNAWNKYLASAKTACYCGVTYGRCNSCSERLNRLCGAYGTSYHAHSCRRKP